MQAAADCAAVRGLPVRSVGIRQACQTGQWYGLSLR